jgi:hypothetical protein
VKKPYDTAESYFDFVFVFLNKGFVRKKKLKILSLYKESLNVNFVNIWIPKFFDATFRIRSLTITFLGTLQYTTGARFSFVLSAEQFLCSKKPVFNNKSFHHFYFNSIFVWYFQTKNLISLQNIPEITIVSIEKFSSLLFDLRNFIPKLTHLNSQLKFVC